MSDEWIRLEEYEVPGCKLYVRHSSYTLMTAEERELIWIERIQAKADDVLPWIQAFYDSY